MWLKKNGSLVDILQTITMVLKNQSQDGAAFNNALPPRVRNETYMSDAVSSILATFQYNVKKKQEVPRHPGGIWDTDDAMEVTESCELNDKEKFRQQLSMLTYSSENCVGVALEREDVMDTKEYKSNNRSPLITPAFQKEDFISKELRASDKEGFGEIKMAISSKNQPEKLKKKNSEEVSVERSKRFRTGSISEVYPPLGASNNQTKTEIDMVSGSTKKLSPPTSEPKVTGLPNEMPVQLELKNLLSKVNNSHGLGAKSHINSDAKERKVEVVKSPEKIKEGNLFKSEIDTLRRVTTIFESLGTVNPPRNAVSYSSEIEDLQRICGILKNFESSDSHATDTNPEVPQKVANVPGTCNGEKNMAAGEAVSFLNGIQSDDSKSIESSCRDTGNGVKETSQSLEFRNGCKNNKDNVPLNEDHYNKSGPVWRRQCSDFTADDDKKSDHVSKSKQVVNSEVSGGRPSLNTKKNQANSFMEQLVNGTLPCKPSGSPPPANAFSGLEQIDNDGMVKATASPSRIATSSDAALQFKAAMKALGRPSKVKNVGSPLKTTTSELTDKSSLYKAVEPNAIEKIMNGTLPWKPSGSPPPVAAFSGASVLEDGKLSGIVHVPTSPSRVVNATLPFVAMVTPENTDAMDTTQAKNTAPKSPAIDEAFGPNSVLEEMTTEDLLSSSASSAVAFSGAAVPTAKDSKLPEIIPVSTSPSSDMDVETTRATNSVPSKIQINAMQTVGNVMNTVSPLMAKNGIPSSKAANAESYKEDKQKSLGGVTFPLKDIGAEKSLPNTPSASPAKYIAPPKRHCNETQVGGNLERPPPLRPWRADGGSPRRFNEQSKEGRANAASPRRSFFADSGSTRSVSTWANWRIKDKSPPPRSDAVPKKHLNDTKMSEDSHDQVTKKMTPKPIEQNEMRQSQKEEKVLNMTNRKTDKSASGSKPSEDPNAMISLKVFNEDNVRVEELMVLRNDLARLTRKFPKLIEIVPCADEPDKVLELNAEAVKVFLR